MSVSEREDAALFELLTPSVGREAAMGVIGRLPPAGEPLATAAQAGELAQRMATQDQVRELEQRMATKEQVAELEQRMATKEHVAELEQRMGLRFAVVDERIDALRNELLAAFRGELVTAVSGQTRHVIVATATAVFGIGGLAVTLAQVLG